MLGLIIGLVNQAFGAVEERFISQIGDTEPTPDATSTNRPITLSRSSTTTSPGELVGMKVRIRNAQEDDQTIKPSIDCSADVIEEDSEQANARLIPANGEEIYDHFIFRTAAGIAEAPYLCEIIAVDDNEEKIDEIRSADFTIHIQ